MADESDHEQKIYCVDTSSIIDEPDCIKELGKGGNIVAISEVVLEELDGNAKSDRGDTWRAARKAIRMLDELRIKGRIYHSVEEAKQKKKQSFTNGGLVCWQPCANNESYEFNYSRPTQGDNLILKHAKAIREKEGKKGLEVILVTEDRVFSLKADNQGFPVQNLRLGKRKHISRIEDLYQGYAEFKISNELFETFLNSGSELEKQILLSDLQTDQKNKEIKLLWNQGVILVDKSDNSRRLAARYDHEQRIIKILQYAYNYSTKENKEFGRIKTKNFFGLQPAHINQTIYLDYLLDDNIKLLVANGGYGTGKTTWLMFVALIKTLNIEKIMNTKNKEKIKSIKEVLSGQYSEGIKLFRPEYLSSDYDPGYIPGTMERKIAAFFKPYDQAVKDFLKRIGCLQLVDLLDKQGLIEKQSTSFLQGINIFNSIACVDEAQNGTKNLTEIFVSRLDKGTKAVIAGDVKQLNNRYVSLNNNMLSICSEIIKEHPGRDAAVITLTYNCREDVSNYARFVRGF